MISVAFSPSAFIVVIFLCGIFPSTFCWKCKGCSALQCKPSGSCSASDDDMQPHAAPWFFYDDLIVQKAWAACASSCPLIELPCGHTHYSGAHTSSKYDVAISCETNGMKCVIAIPLVYPSSSSLSRILQLSLTSHNLWIQVAGNASCGAVDQQLRCNGNARLWLRGGIFTGQEQAWVGVAAYRCVSCDSSIAMWIPPVSNPSAQYNQSAIADPKRSQMLDSPSSHPAPRANNSGADLFHPIGLVDDVGDAVSGPCFSLSACLAVGQSASGMLLALTTACIDDQCHRYMLISAGSLKVPVASHIFSFASIERAVVSRHDAEMHLYMRSGPALRLKLPLSPCLFSHHILLELQQHLVLLDDVVTASLNASCIARALPILQGDSVCVFESHAAAAHQMATAWHDHLLHLQIISGSHVSQEDAEAAQLKLQTQARASLCADDINCEVTCLSCDGAFIASTSSRVAVAKLPLDKPVRAHRLSQVISVDTMSDGVVRLFLVHDESADADALHVDLPFQLCSQDEVEQFLPNLIDSLEQNRMEYKDVGSNPKPNSEGKESTRSSALTNLSNYWTQQRDRWPMLPSSFVGLVCVDGAIAISPQESDITQSLVHRVFSNDELKLVAMESRCVSSVSLHSQRTLLLTSSCGNFSIECSALNSFQIPAFIAILHSAMTKSAPRTLHHQAHANHQRHLQSVSVSEQITSAALDNIRVIIDRECGFPVYYTGCSAAQCVCVSAFNISVVSLLPTIPLSTSATSINISAIASLRAHESGVSIQLDDTTRIFISVSPASSMFLLTTLQDLTGISKHHFFEHSQFTENIEHEHDAVEIIDENSNDHREQQSYSSFSVVGHWIHQFHPNGTLQWRENICKIGHFVQVEKNLIGITSVSADLLLQLQAIAQWVLVHCDIVIPVSTDVPGDERFIHFINTSHVSDIGNSVLALHQAAVLSRKSLNCSEFDYSFQELKKCASSLPQNRTFNSSSLLETLQPFATSSMEYSVHSTTCVQWDLLPTASISSSSDAHFDVEMWISCSKTQRVLALSKSAIMLLSAVTHSSCELQVFPFADIQNVRSISNATILIFTRSSGAIPMQLSDFPSIELAILLTTVNVWALRG